MLCLLVFNRWLKERSKLIQGSGNFHSNQFNYKSFIRSMSVFLQISGFIMLSLFSICRGDFSCPLTDYQESVLKGESLTLQKTISPQQEFGIGFWSTFATFQSQQEESLQDYQLLFFQRVNGQISLIYSASSSTYGEEALFQIWLFWEGQVTFINTYPLSTQLYEGIWIYHYFGFQPATYSIQYVTYQQGANQEVRTEVLFVYLPSDEFELQFAVGGTLDTSKFSPIDHLKQYPGLFSKPLFIETKAFFTDFSLFVKFALDCQMPTPNYQIHQIITNAAEINKNQPIVRQLYVEGARYAVRGWIKFDEHRINIEDNGVFNVFRLSTNTAYNPNRQLGDEVLKLQYQVRLQHQSILKFQQTNFKYPRKGNYFLQIDDYLNKLQNQYDSADIEVSSSSRALYKWHFFYAEYGRNLRDPWSWKTIFKVEFPGEERLVEKTTGSDQFGFNQFANCQMYLSLGASDYTSNDSGITAILASLDFLILDRDLDTLYDCHPSCKTCSGPSELDCILCSPQRSLLNSKCLCNEGTVHLSISSECIPFNEFYADQPQFDELDQEDTGCPIYTFQYKSGCLSCPYLPQSSSILCVDCLLNPQSWFSNPLCQNDYIQISQRIQTDVQTGGKPGTQQQTQLVIGPYEFKARDETAYQLFLINEQDQLFECIGCKGFSFCNDCESDLYHMRQKIDIECRSDLFKSGSRCLKPQKHCDLYSPFGVCLSCQQGYYLSEKKICEMCHSSCKGGCQMSGGLLQCISCEKRFGILNGICQPCGRFCELCEADQAKKIGVYLRCLKCIDTRKYYIQVNARECAENQTPNCNYAIEAFYLDKSRNSITLNFEPYYEKENDFPIIQCAFCQPNFYAVQHDSGCWETYVPEEFSTCDSLVMTLNGRLSCLVGPNQNSRIVTKDCYLLFKKNKCNDCITQRTNKPVECILCFVGYYSRDGACQQCPDTLYCKTCARQLKKSKDLWKSNVRAFYEALTEGKTDYREMVESTNEEDYEIICTSCKEGEILANDRCYTGCGQNCDRCVFNSDRFVCLQCKSDSQGRLMSFMGNECIECPSGCELCAPKSEEEIKRLNPYFSREELIAQSYSCLLPRGFDVIFQRRFRQFKHSQRAQLMRLKISVICSQEKYEQLQQSAQDKAFFRRTHISLGNLFNSQGSFLEEYQKAEFLKEMSHRFVTKIEVELNFSGEEYCFSEETNGLIVLSFFEGIFTLEDVELKFKGPSELKLPTTTQFQGANRVIFQDLKIVSQNTKMISHSTERFQLIFRSVFIECQRTGFFIDIQKGRAILFQSVSIFNLLLSSSQQLISLSNNSPSAALQIRELLLSDSEVKNTVLIISSGSLVVSIKQFELSKSEFTSAKIIAMSDYFKESDFEATDLILENFKCSKTPSLLDLIHFKQAHIANSRIQDSEFMDSNLIILNKQTSFKNIQLLGNKVLGASVLLQNTVQLNSMEIVGGTFNNNLYHQGNSFLVVREFQTVDQGRLSIIDMQFVNNRILDNGLPIQSFTLEQCLFLIAIPQILLQNLIIHRAFGYTEICLQNSQEIYINNVVIRRNEDENPSCLHVKVSCAENSQQQFYQASVFHLYGGLNTTIKYLTLERFITYNFPVIHYESLGLSNRVQIEYLTFQNCIFKSNVLLLIKDQSQASILRVISDQEIHINFKNPSFIGNLMNDYKNDQSNTSPSLLLISSPKSWVIFTGGIVRNNLITNSTNTLFNFFASKVTIYSSTFEENMKFNFSQLQPYLSWGFENSIGLDQLEMHFPIKALAGIGFLQVAALNISNSTFRNCQGTQSGALIILTSEQGLIRISGSVFTSLSSTLDQRHPYSGGFRIDSSNSFLSLLVQECIVSDIQGLSQGGFLLIHPSNLQNSITVLSSRFENLYAQQGSLIYAQFIETSSSNIKISNCSFQNDFLFQLQYLHAHQPIQQTWLYSTIFVVSGKLSINDVDINSLHVETFLFLQNTQELAINQLKFQQSYLSLNQPKFFTLKSQLLYLYSQAQVPLRITIERVQIVHLNMSLQSPNGLNCPQREIKQPEEQYQCERKGITPFMLYRPLLTLGPCNFLATFNEQSIIEVVVAETVRPIMLFENIYFTEVICKSCTRGLIYLNLKKFEKVQFTNIYLLENECGLLGCIIISESTVSLADLAISPSRILQQMDQLIQAGKGDVIKLVNMRCNQNKASYGTCVFIKNQKVLISDSEFTGNEASQIGGALFSIGNRQLWIFKSIVSANKAKYSAGIYIESGLFASTETQTIIQNNQATNFGDNLQQLPSRLKLALSPNFLFLETSQLLSNKTYLMEKLVKDFVYLPTGTKISEYLIFNRSKDAYFPLNYKFRIVPTDSSGSVQKVLFQSLCELKATLKSQSNLSAQGFNPLSVYQVAFDNNSNSYVLDDLIVYLDPDNENSYVQLDAKCDSVEIPIIEDKYLIIDYHSNYFLRINIKAFPCQMGEVKHFQFGYCLPCDQSIDQFSLNPKNLRCEVRNEQTTSEITPAQLKLREGYWRPAMESNHIEECINRRRNCLGGWKTAEQSCIKGHLGALCEECDLYNIRGDGAYSIDEQFSCSPCVDFGKQIIYIVTISVWTLFSIGLTIRSTAKMINEHQKFASQISVSTLVKIFTNYLQILVSLTTFQLQFSNDVINILNSFGNPIQTFIYSIDCFLGYGVSLSIIYARIMWLMVMPFLYMILILAFYAVMHKFRKVEFQDVIWSTTLIYSYIYFNPSITNGLLSLLSYREISSIKWIQGNVAYNYDNKSHQLLIFAVFLPLLVIIVAFVPAVVMINLFAKRKRLNYFDLKQRWGYLYIEYKKETYYWEFVKILQKQIIILFMVFYQDRIVIKASFIYFTIVTYQIISHRFLPYKQSQLNFIDLHSATVCSISMVIGITTFMAQSQQMREIVFILQFSLGLLNGHFILKMVILIIDAYLREINYHLDHLRDKIKLHFPGLIKHCRYLKMCLENRRERRERVKRNFEKIKVSFINQSRRVLVSRLQTSRLLSLKPCSDNKESYEYTHNKKSENNSSLDNYSFSQIQQQKKQQTLCQMEIIKDDSRSLIESPQPVNQNLSQSDGVKQNQNSLQVDGNLHQLLHILK